MPRAIRRSSVLSGVALFVLLVGGVGVAQANNNTLRLTLNHYAPKIVKDENVVSNGVHVQYPQGHWIRLTRALKHEVSDLHALNKKLLHESASSARGRKGKTLIVNGLKLIATAYSSLRRDILAVHGGPVAASKVKAAVKTDKKGRSKLLAGLNLLG